MREAVHHRRADAAHGRQAQRRHEPFTREKAIAGVRKACKGRPVDEDDLARLGQTVEDTLRGDGWAEVPAHEIGLAILGPLRELDEVAYLRFASVYRAFESADDFETEIAMLRSSEPHRLEPTSASSGMTTTARVRSGEAAPGHHHSMRQTSVPTKKHEAATTNQGSRR